jgi:hypothetical protein
MNEILMVDGYDTPIGFDGVRRRRKARKARRVSRRRSRKGGRKMTASKVCAGAKRRKLCLRVAGKGLRRR